MENRKVTPFKSERLHKKSGKTMKKMNKKMKMVQQIDESTISNEASKEPIRVPRYKWTTEDEIEILKALIKLKEQGKCVDRVPNELYGMMQSSLKDSVTQAQFEDKVEDMRIRFKLFQLSSKLWGEALEKAAKIELEMQQLQTERAELFKETIELILATSKSTTK